MCVKRAVKKITVIKLSVLYMIIIFFTVYGSTPLTNSLILLCWSNHIWVRHYKILRMSCYKFYLTFFNSTFNLRRMMLTMCAIIKLLQNSLNVSFYKSCVPSALWITLQWDGLEVYMNMIRVVNNKFKFISKSHVLPYQLYSVGVVVRMVDLSQLVI